MGARSLGWRLGAWMFAATATLAVLLVIWFRQQMHELLDRASHERLSMLARHVAAESVLGALAQEPARSDLLRGPLEGAMSHPDVTAVAVYDPSGAVLSARSRGGGTVPPRQVAAAACEPCSAGDGRLRWIAPIVASAPARPVVTAASYEGPPPPATSAAVPAGWLLVDATTSGRVAAERQIAARGLLIAAGALLLALAATLVISRRLTSPLRALAQATRDVGRGRRDVRLPRSASQEIAQLAADFEAMTAALAALDQENARYRGHLEEMVATRTRELERAYEEMKGMADAKDHFVATVSHDFRSPLAIVQSAVQTVLADPAMPDDVRRQFLSRAERQCKRLGALVGDLLDLARIENREAALERTSLGDLVEETLDGARAGFEERSVDLRWAPPASAVIAEVDRGLVVRALSNLVDNARKFTPAGGRVTVELERRDGAACIRVSDTGPGVPDAERERIFERFFQGRAAQALGTGSGLGLAIVAGVARRHGGTVAVTSASGRGATFELALPLSQP